MADYNLPYRGRYIVQVKPESGFDCLGFTMPCLFQVHDDFGDHALPTIQGQWWSPLDAIQAINFVDITAPEMKGPKWPTTVIHEYNIMLNYHRNFDFVYHTIQKIKEACRQSKDFDDNPREDIEKLLHSMHLHCMQGRRVLG